MVNINNVYESKYLSATDLQGKEPTVTITQVEMAKMQDDQAKICVYVNNRPKGIVLNKTNARSIGALYGDETDRWVGKKIKLIKVWTDFQGKPVEAIRILPPGAEQAFAHPDEPIHHPEPPPAMPDDFNDEIPF